jgi:transposase
MSNTTIARYFPFRRVKVVRQSVSEDTSMSWIVMEPDLRFVPRCWHCGQRAKAVHQHARRAIRDLSLATAKVLLNVHYRKIACARCGRIRVEHHDFVEPYARVTHRLAKYVHELCKHMSVTAVAEHTGLDWKTVKNIDKHFLEKEFGQTRYDGLRILAIDEISILRGHTYMTVVLNYETGEVVWMGKGRKTATLDEFFGAMPEAQRDNIKAVAIDMWNPYIKAILKWCPSAHIVFDLFHVVRAFGKVIDKVRNQEAKRAQKEEQDIYKGSRYLLLKNKENLTPKQRPRLRELLRINKTLSSLYILKDYLKKLWWYKHVKSAEKFLQMWRRLAYAIPSIVVHNFANMLERYKYGILNHCLYPIHTGVLEGVNNKIKLISKQAYGFHDTRYFSLKVIQAFSGDN